MKSTKNEVTNRYETVTPQKAREYLGTSIGNRPIKAAKVQLFTQYMKAGEWNKYAQPIYFDEDGRLMDVTSGCSCGYHDPDKAFRVEILINGKSTHKAIVPSEMLSGDKCTTILRDVIEKLATFDPNQEAK